MRSQVCLFVPRPAWPPSAQPRDSMQSLPADVYSRACAVGIKSRLVALYGVACPEFERLVEAHYASLYRFGLSLSRSETEACDLVQQTFLLWAARGHQLRDPAKARSWLLTTLHREFLHDRRHETRFPHHEMNEVAAELPAIAPTVADDLDADTVMRALLQVDEVYRVPLSLFYLEDMSYKEIAAFLDMPAGTVMSRLARGKEQLRELLADAAGTPGERLAARCADNATPENCHG